MTDHQSTHGQDCWGWGPRHYDCAVREIERLREQLRLATVDQATAEAEASDAHAENKRLREALGRILENEASDKQKSIARAWNEGFDFAMKACGWQEGEDPSTEGLYVARDSKGNVEVGMWYAKTLNSQPAEWDREFRDVDRDDIVAWIAIPDWRTARDASKLSDAMLRARENTNDRRDAAPAVQGGPVAYISQEDFEFLLSDDMSEQYGTRQAPVFSRKDCRDPVPLYASPQPPAQIAEGRSDE